MRFAWFLLLSLTACSRALDPGASFELPDGSVALPSLDADCWRSGYTGRDLLALLAPSYATSYVPTEPGSDTDDAAWIAAHGTPLAIEVASAGAAGCGPPQTECPPGPGCFQTQPTLSVSLTIGFHTADGTFDEELAATATWVPQPGTSEQWVSWAALVPASSLRGSYQVWSGPGALGPASQVSLDFAGTFAGSGAGDSGAAGQVTEQIATGGGVESGGDGGGMFGDDL